MYLDRFAAAETAGHLRPEIATSLEPTQEEYMLRFTPEQLHRLDFHISKLNEIMARQEARALRLGWPGISVCWIKREP